VTDLTIKNNDLVVATQGRAFYVLDDLSMVQQKGETLPDQNLKVFEVNEAFRTEGSFGRRNTNRKGAVHNAGENPPNGVIFNYYLHNPNDSSAVSISLYDKRNKLIKTFSKKSKEEGDKIDFKPGMNQFVWDMLYPPGEKVEGMILWNGGVGSIKAAPGKYKARFRYEKDSVEVLFTIKGNPNYNLNASDYDAQVDFLLKIRDKFNEVQKGIKNIRSLRSQIQDFTGKMDKQANKDIQSMADSIQKSLTATEEALYQTKSKSGQDVLNFPIRLNDKLAGLYGVASSGENPPSKQEIETYADLEGQSDVQLNRLKKLMQEDIPRLNKMILSRQVPVIGVKEE
jgi:hypothetical protein